MGSATSGFQIAEKKPNLIKNIDNSNLEIDLPYSPALILVFYYQFHMHKNC